MPKKKAAVPSFLKLQTTLKREKTCHVTRIAWSNRGDLLAVPTQDGTVELWLAGDGRRTFEIVVRQGNWTTDVAWAPDDKILATLSGDELVRLWRVPNAKRIFSRLGESVHIEATALAWSPDGKFLITCKGTAVQAWDTDTWRKAHVAEMGSPATFLVFSKAGRLAICTRDGAVYITDSSLTHQSLATQHNRPAVTAAWSPDGEILALGHSYGDLQTFDVSVGRVTQTIEGHTKTVRSVSISANGQLLASKSDDGKVWLWDLRTGMPVEGIDEPFGGVKDSSTRKPGAIAFHPQLPLLATLDAGNHNVRLWNVDIGSLQSVPLPAQEADPAIRYTTAKIVLVGDSGVGKTGLGWRLAHGEFKEHSSTHGQQFWVLNQLHSVRADGTECEAVLWDLAGQADYRLTHALFLEKVDAALVLFDPGNQIDPLKGVRYWLNALDRDTHKPIPKILVGAREDRAASTLTPADLMQFCNDKQISGGARFCSAMTGKGIQELLDSLSAAVHWDEMTATTTTSNFKRVKDFVLNAKQSDATRVLLSPAELEQQLHAVDRAWKFSAAEMMTAVHHLANHGYVSILPRSSGDQSILMFPQVQSNLAASFVLEARRHPNGLGALEETRLLRGEYQFPEIANLSAHDRETLLDSTVALFLQRNICFRERLGPSTLLVFPALINQRKPPTEYAFADDVSYVISGPVENVYAALVVLLGYTNTFTRTNHWQNQAEYEMNPGEICGFRQISEQDGEIELVHYYSPEAGPEVRSLFQALFEGFLRSRKVTVKKYAPVFCPECHERAERAAVLKRLRDHKPFLFCANCGAQVRLVGEDSQPGVTGQRAEILTADKEIARRRTAFEAALGRIKALIRDRNQQPPPSCFISYAWGVSAHEKRVLQLAKDLERADVNVLIDRQSNARIGASVADFVDKLDAVDFVIVVGTPDYLHKYQSRDQKYGHVVSAEIDLIQDRLTGSRRHSVLPALLAGDGPTSFPPLLRGAVRGDLVTEAKYFSTVVDLILSMFQLPFEDPIISNIRAESNVEDWNSSVSLA